MVRRGIVQVVLTLRAPFDLQGGVVDAETVVQRMRGGVDEGIVILVFRTHQVRG